MTKEQWQEIKDKYPKAFRQIVFYTYYSAKDIHKDGKLYIDGKMEIDYEEMFLNDSLPCFCDILKFFDSVGIVINTCYFNKDVMMVDTFGFNIDIPSDMMRGYRFASPMKKTDRKEAEKLATIKAFEILNTMIEKGEL